MWGDMVSGRPDLVASLPRGVTVCEWGYDDWYPFDERCAVLAEAGVPFWVAPGTSSWMSILGRLTNARTTCRRAAAAALAHGGSGYLNTDWGDLGHLQQPVISEPGLAYGAAVSWCLAANGDLHLGAALSTHVFGDGTGALADAVLALGDAHRLVTPQFPNMSALVMNLYYPQLPVGRGLTAGLTVSGARRGRRVPGRRTRRCAGPARPQRRPAADRRGPLQHRSRRLVDRRCPGTSRGRRIAQLGAGRGASPPGRPPRRARRPLPGPLEQPQQAGWAHGQPQLAAQPASRLRIGASGSTLGRPVGPDRHVGDTRYGQQAGTITPPCHPHPRSASSSSSASWQSHEQ